jgi:DNA-binding CsgD family transcriptional regulator
MIVSRTAELARLDALLAALMRGEGSALVVHGEAGIGKTTLLEALAERSGGAVTVLRACGAETEAELAFSALTDLLYPVLRQLDALPAPQAAALMGALALQAPAPGDRLAVCVAALGMLRAEARRSPVLVVVDDVQWVDASSRECIEYVARRASGPLAVVLAARDPWYPPERIRLPDLPVGPVDDCAAAELLRQRAPELAPPVAAAIAQAAAGNPLALVELPATLTAGQRAGVVALELPLGPGGRLQRAFAGRVEALSGPARTALLIAAAYAGTELPVIAAACRRAGTDAGQLADAEASGLVRLGAGLVTFAHPLIRGLVYSEARAAARRAAHAALATVLRDDDDRRAWHLAMATIGPDEEVAAALERAGGRAVARRAYAAGSGAIERAARLSPDPEAASRRLITAGQAAAGAGQADRALALLAEAAELTGDAEQRARAQQLRGRMLIWRGRPAEATPLLVDQARQVASRWPVLAAVMLADAANGATNTGSYLEAERLVRSAAGLLRDGDDPAVRGAVLGVLGWTLALRGKTPEARTVLTEAARFAAGRDWLGPDWAWLHVLLRSRIMLGEFEQAQAESLELCQRARDAGALAALSGVLHVAADTTFRLGDWDAADTAALEAIQVAGEVGQPAVAGWMLTIRARILAARDRPEESRAAALTALQIAESERIGAGLPFVHAALGFLELGLDRVDAAFAGALAFDDRRPMPFERARTLLAFGRRLHRARRRPEARQRLRAALEEFERLHADAWTRQAEAELRAAGGRHRPPQDDRALTPQERRVAAAVQSGASNRDIAAGLFLSPKTVEFHLRQIYRKLDVHSRTQLVAALAEKSTAS